MSDDDGSAIPAATAVVESAIAQVALCTSDLPRTVRTLTEVFGFVNAGGRPRWGRDVSRIQELPSGDDASVMMWWVVGRQDFVQIELFHHFVPAQRPRPREWLPSDLGWSRIGIMVPDFDRCLERLSGAGLPTLTAPLGPIGHRRVCVREPAADVIIEIIEEDGSLTVGRSTVRDLEPALVYIAVSVSDLVDARRHFADALGMREIEPDALHGPDHEALWGLPGAQRTCAVFQGGDVLLEVSEYQDPPPRRVPPDPLLSDQGICNAAWGYRESTPLRSAMAAAERLGATTSTGAPTVVGGSYLRITDDISIELLLVPPALDADFGFAARPLVLPAFDEADPSTTGRD